MLDLFQGLKVLPVDGCARFQPPLGSRLSRKARGVEQNAPRHDAVLQRVDVASWTAACRLDLIHRYAVIALTVGHNVTVHRIEMAVNDSVVTTGILVAIESNTRADVDHRALQDSWSIDCAFLNHVVGERYCCAILYECQRLLSFGRRDEVRSAEFVFLTPASPVGKLLHRLPEVRIGCNRWARVALRASVTDKESAKQSDSRQSYQSSLAKFHN